MKIAKVTWHYVSPPAPIRGAHDVVIVLHLEHKGEEQAQILMDVLGAEKLRRKLSKTTNAIRSKFATKGI